MFSDLYGEFARAFAEDGNGPFWLARIVSQTAPEFDDGGSLVVSDTGPWLRDCVVQVDQADTAMRTEQGFAEGDRRMIVPASSLSGPVTTDNQVVIRNGPFAGDWNIESVRRDAAASEWVMRGRPA